MKKLAVLLVACVSMPVLAQEADTQDQGHEAFAKAHQKQMEKMKATQEKMSKLVKEYKGLKEGKKKDAKHAELEKEVAAIRDEQLKFKQEQLAKFEQRLATMKEEFAEESAADKKTEWVNKKTQELIDKDGSMKALFDRPQGRHGSHMRQAGKPGKGHFFGKGPKGPRNAEGKFAGGKEHRKGHMPPPDAELPVQKPVEK